jgi:hypothetical protein
VKVVQSFRVILSNWHYLTPHLQGRTRLSDINSELQNILTHIKNGIDNKRSNGAAGNKTGPAAGAVRNKGASNADLEALKHGGATGGEERTEFTDAEVVG